MLKYGNKTSFQGELLDLNVTQIVLFYNVCEKCKIMTEIAQENVVTSYKHLY